MRKWAFGVVAVALAAMSGQGVALADSSAAQLPPNWHIHDGGVGPQHKAISFFPTILGISTADYLQDPARCPNATDKVFLPSVEESKSDVLRAGVCVTSTTVIHLRTVPVGTSGPAGWKFLPSTEPGFDTYYMVTPR
jgi:hypothetical protein